MVDIDLSFSSAIKVIGSQTFSVPSGSQECVFYFSDGVNIFAERQLNDVNISVSVNGGGGSSMRESYFTIEAVEDTTITLGYAMEWTKDYNIWYTSSSLNPVLSKGERIYVRGNSSLDKITSTGYFRVSGNLASLVYYNGFSDKDDLNGCNCYNIFKNNNTLIDASGLYLPKNANYSYLFYQCKKLTKAMPVIQVVYTDNASYEYMFTECTSLLEAPDMVFESTTQPSCRYMFQGCTKLKKAKGITTRYANLDNLRGMFLNCSSLVSVGSINLEEINGYRLCASMFENCSSLTGITFSNGNLWIGEKSCENMFKNCTSLTEVKGLSYLSMRNNYACNGMFYGCTSLSSLGRLKFYIENNVENSCQYMFYNCIKLTKDSFGDYLYFNVNNTNNFYSMFAGCTGMTETPIIYIENNVEYGLEGLLNGIITLTKAKIKCCNDYVQHGCYGLFGYTTAKNGVIVTNDVYGFLYGVDYDYNTENDGSEYDMEDYRYFVPDTWTIEQDSSL